MRTIWKYEVPANNIELPESHTWRYLDVQGEGLCAWAEVDTETPKIKVDLFYSGTGHSVPPTATYVGTWRQGVFVFHMWEAKR